MFYFHPCPLGLSAWQASCTRANPSLVLSTETEAELNPQLSLTNYPCYIKKLFVIKSKMCQWLLEDVPSVPANGNSLHLLDFSF